MQYQNRQPQEGINVTRHNALLHFAKLMLALLVLIVVLIVSLNFLGASIAKRVPFRYELALIERLDINFGDDNPEQLVEYLELLSNRLAPFMPVPEGMQFSIHYNASDVFNAFATVGGNIVFYRELLREMPHENALAMIMAHEMSHVIHRDPLASAGGGIASTLGIMLLTSSSDLGGDIVGQTGTLTQLNFSREMENEADRAALQAVASYYGHVAGADTFFRILSGNRAADSDANQAGEGVISWIAEFGSTHPLDQSRIESIAGLAQDNDWAVEGQLTPLPADFQRWLGLNTQ